MTRAKRAIVNDFRSETGGLHLDSTATLHTVQGVQRVQCKYTQQRHTEMLKKSPDHPVWEVSLRQTGRRTGESGRVLAELIYDETSFDLLFISTPEGDYL